MVEVKTKIAMGFKGKLSSEETLEYYLEQEKKIKNGEIKGFNPLTPLYHADIKFEPILIENSLEETYNNLITSEKYIPGAFGDVLKVMEINDGNNITKYLIEIGQKAFPQTSEATDTAQIIKSKDNNYYGIWIKRKNEPGKGNAAFPGGFCSSDGRVDSPIYTALKEPKEEIGLKWEENIEDYRYDYNLKELKLNVIFNNKKNPGIIKYIGTFKTGDELMKDGGERLSENSKQVRVDKTHFYTLTVDSELKSKELEKVLENNYHAGDDASEVIIVNITDYIKNNDANGLKEQLKCGIKHHETLVDELIESFQ